MSLFIKKRAKKLKIALFIGTKSPKKILKLFKNLLLRGPKATLEKIKQDEIFKKETFSFFEHYQSWLELNPLKQEDLENQKKENVKFSFRPKISIITPTYNTDPEFLKECINSVTNQTYDNWELCLADDASTNKEVRRIIEKYANKDKRIKYVFRKVNGNICEASNSALKIAKGEFIGLLDHDDILQPNALFEVVKLLDKNPEADFIYSDEDKIDKKTQVRSDPFFKPDWSPDLLNSFMYIGHFTIYRKSLVNEVGNFDPEVTYSQDYDLALKISEKTKNIFHIGKILYSWRIHPASQTGGGKPFARTTNLKALENSMKRKGYKGKVVEYPFANKFDYEIDRKKKVSVIIPSDSFGNSTNLINSILEKTSYFNTEILLVINSKTGKEVANAIKSEKLKIVNFDREFNFSAKCNLGAKVASGDHFIFLNDDMEILQESWIDGLIEYFQRRDVGAVSPKLLYEDGTIQHAGMVTGVRGLVGTAFHKKPADSFDYFNLIQSTRNCSILSAACLAIPKKIFEKAGGFDESNTPINHSDIDFSFKIRDLGYLLVYTPFVSLRHFGHQTIGKVAGSEREKVDKNPDLFVLKRWGEMVAYDPYYPPGMRDFLYGHGFGEFKIIPSKQAYKEKKEEKNLLFVGHEASLTGAPLLIFWLAKELRKKGFSIIFYLPSRGPIIELLEKEGFITFIDAEAVGEVREETRRFIVNFDLILTNTIDNWRWVFASKAVGALVAWYIHESKYGLNKLIPKKKTRDRIFIKEAFSTADLVLFPSRAVEKDYREHLNTGKSSVLLSGVEEFSDKARNKPNNHFNILHIGSIEKRKGQDVVVDAFLRLPKNIQDKTKLLLVGRVLDKSLYRSLLRKTRSFANVRFIGEVGTERVRELFLESDLFVCSSRDETGPLTVIEAIAGRVPVITTKVGLVEEVFTDNRNALIIKSGSSVELKEAIEKIYKDLNLREKLINNGYKLFLEKFTIENYSKNFISLISKFLN